jgi:hypothetical protein
MPGITAMKLWRVIVLLAVLGLGVAACGGAGGSWSVQDAASYTKNCVEFIGGPHAASICQCVLAKAEQHFPNYAAIKGIQAANTIDPMNQDIIPFQGGCGTP